jgi:hypothetical protein
MKANPSRRDVLRRGAALGALFVAGGEGCKSAPQRLSCVDTSSMLPTDVQIRATLGYVDASVEPGKTCLQCQQFVAPPTAGGCGTCKVVKGPINPTGYCKSFSAKPA